MAHTPPNTDLVIIVGGFVNALGLVRSLAALTDRVIVITTQAHDMAQHSRYVSRHHHVDELDKHPERLAALLESQSENWDGALIIPTNDEAVASLDMHREKLDRWYRIAIPPAKGVPYLLDRRLMLEAASRAGMTLPVCYGPATASSVEKTDIHYPVVIKPVISGEFSSRLGRKLLECENAAALGRCVERLAGHGLAGDIFERVPGPDSEIFAYCVYVDKEGRPVAECTVRKLRQSPPFFGVARVARLTQTRPDLREQSLEMLRNIGFHGFASLEFKRDIRDDTFRFFEVNGRSVIYNSLLQKGGLDIAALTLADHGDHGVGRTEQTASPGTWIHLHADLLRSLQNCRREQLSLRDYLRPYGGEKTFAVFSSKDPAPFRKQWSHSFRRAVSRRPVDTRRSESMGSRKK